MKESRTGFCRKGRGRPFHVDGPKTEKAREPAVESLTWGIGGGGGWGVGGESIRSRAVREGGCVKLKTVTELRQSSARDTLGGGDEGYV